MKIEENQAPYQSQRRQVLASMLALGLGGIANRSWAHDAARKDWPLWEVTGEGGRAYLFGELSARKSKWHDRRIEQLLLQCKSLWTETNELWRGDRRQLIFQHGMDRESELMQKLNPSEQARLKQAAALAQVPVESLTPLRPWTAALTIEGAYYQQLQRAKTNSAEAVLIPQANQAGLSVNNEFPAQDDLISTMGALSKEQDIQFLNYVLDQILSGAETIDRFFSRWENGDISLADKELHRIKTAYPAMYQRMVLQRNQDWVARFKTMLTAEGTAMVVMGYLHVAGPDSVIVQLEKAGYKVRRI